MSNKTLLFFTSSFPFGKQEAFIENEINFLAEGFSKIHIITNDITSTQARSIPQNVSVHRRNYHLEGFQKIAALRGLFNSKFWTEMLFVIRVLKIVPSSRVVFTALASLQKTALLKHWLNDKLKISGNSDFTAYSYWSDDNAVALALLKKHFPKSKFTCRAHRWDVYYAPGKGEYLPFRQKLADDLDGIFFISNHAKKFFEKLHLFAERKTFFVARLGTLPIEQKNEVKPDKNLFHIVSCSSVIPRKRVLLLAESIAQVSSTKKIRWTHFGDGSEMEKLKKIVRENMQHQPNTEVDLKGRVENESVRKFYALHHVDVFINVSASEGVPVSMMEAMSASIPVIATDVDAVSEIVQNQQNGVLLPATPSISLVAETISLFMNMNEIEQMQFRKNAFQTWHEHYNASKNYQLFVNRIGNL